MLGQQGIKRAGDRGNSAMCVCVCVSRHLESSPCTWPLELPVMLPCRSWTSSSRMGESLPAVSSLAGPPTPFHGTPPPHPHPLPACFPPGTSLQLPPPSGHLDAKAADGNTALHCAALHGQLDCLKLLLKGRAPVGAGAALCPLQTLFTDQSIDSKLTLRRHTPPGLPLPSSVASGVGVVIQF